MKKAISIFVAIAFALSCAFALAACSDDDSMSGTWVCAAVRTGDDIIDISEYSTLIGKTGAELATLELNSDGTVGLTVMGTDMLAESGYAADELKWKEGDSCVNILTSSGDETLYSLSYDSSLGRLEMKYNDESIYFEKQGS